MPQGQDNRRHSPISRRSFLALGAGAATATLAPGPLAAAVRVMPERTLTLYNTHTGEHLKTVYWSGGSYIPSSLSTVNHFLRDHRSGETHPMDPHVLDVLTAIQHRFGGNGPIHIVSGYRSPATNAWLASMSGGVARNSLHMQGKAIDIRIPGRSVRAVSHVAASLRAGGVGTYPASDFVHVDTGRVRYW
ncbi:MAG: DUF882 domain-containing protein [Magnetospirillum sp.]|nr:DUF882 domain-containing protein [Magnetospirillum sp.]